MGTTLTGKKINATYDSLLKLTDNDGLTASLKIVTDGVGLDSPLSISTSEVKIGGNLQITGDLTVEGTATYLNTDNVTIKDGLILVANNNTADILDIGFFGKYNDGAVKYTGLYRDASDGVFKIFDGLTTEPTTTVGGGDLADLGIADLSAVNATLSGSVSTDSIVNYSSSSTPLSIGGTSALIFKTDNTARLTITPTGTANFSGDVSAVDATFSGDVSAAEGTFSTGLNIITGLNTGANTLYFEGADSTHSAWLKYFPEYQQLNLGQAGKELKQNSGGQWFMGGAGNMGGILNMSGNLWVGGNGTFTGNVGIGVSPNSTLHSHGNITVSNAGGFLSNLYYSSGWKFVENGYGFANYVDTTGNYRFYNTNNNTSGAGAVATLTEAMRIDSSGVVQVRNETPTIQLYNTDTSLIADQLIGTLDFYKSDASGEGAGVSSSIQVHSENSIGSISYMSFHTDGGIGDQNVERMRIDSSGNVGIGTDSPDTALNIEGTGDSDSKIRVERLSNGRTQLGFNYLSANSSDGLKFLTGTYGGSTTERMRIDSSGNVGIGGIPDVKFQAEGTYATAYNPEDDFSQDGEGTQIKVLNNDNTAESFAAINFEHGTSQVARTRIVSVRAAGNNAYIAFVTEGSADMKERMRITSGGFLKASNTGSYSSTTASYHEIRSDKANSYIARFDNTTSTNSGFAGVNIRYTDISPDSTSNSFLVCEDSTTVRMRVYSDGDVWTSDAGTLTSDETLKTNITDTTPKLDDVMNLKVRNYYWREDYHPEKADKKLIGFIAQEFEEVFPNLVSEHKIKEEELAEDGTVIQEAVYKKGIKEGKLIPVIVKAMQEQQEIIKSQGDLINDLTKRIETLENRQNGISKNN